MNDMKKEKNILELLGELVVSLLAIATTALARSFVFMKLWGWFIVPLGVSDIKLWHSAGLCSLLGYVQFKYEKHESESIKEYPKRVMISLGVAAIYLLIGWIFYSL